MENLAELPKRVGFRVLRVALFAWGGVVKRIQMANAKRGPTGALAKSSIVKVVIPDASANVAHHGKPPRVMVGPSRRAISFSGQIGGKEKRLTPGKARKYFARGGRVRVNRPSRYAHLVEKGIAGKKHIMPAPFVAPSVEAGRTSGMDIFTAKLAQGIAREAAALTK